MHSAHEIYAFVTNKFCSQHSINSGACSHTHTNAQALERRNELYKQAEHVISSIMKTGEQKLRSLVSKQAEHLISSTTKTGEQILWSLVRIFLSKVLQVPKGSKVCASKYLKYIPQEF